MKLDSVEIYEKFVTCIDGKNCVDCDLHKTSVNGREICDLLCTTLLNKAKEIANELNNIE